MADIDMALVEEHPSGKLVYSLRVRSAEGRMEFPIAVQNEGTAASNEVAALRAALRFAEELAEILAAASRIMSFRIEERMELACESIAVRWLSL